MRLILMVAAAALSAGTAFAQDAAMPAQPAAPCALLDQDLPEGLGDWAGGADVATARGADQLDPARLALGKGYQASLLNTQRIAFPVQPEKPGGAIAYAGLFSFTVETEGAYTVALGAGAWIDVLEDGRSVTPTRFGHGPACTSVRKMVVFPLKPGIHVLQVSANAEPRLRLMVAKAA